MINKIRNRLRKSYEKNEKRLGRLYFISLIMLCITFKYKELKEEMEDSITTFSKHKKYSKKELKKIRKEIILYRLIYKLRPGEYFLFETPRRTLEERASYITREMTNGYYKKINDFDAINILNDKFLSYKAFKDLYNRDVLYVSSDEQKNEFIEFVKRNKKFVVKPLEGHGGVGIEFLNADDFKSDDELFNHVSKILPFITEEIVVQNKKMASFHEKSLNTVRVVTFQLNGHMSIVWAFFRVGQGDASVDNMTSGGLGVQVDPDTGILLTDGIDYLGDKVEKHPDSGIKFKGYQIPDWEGLKSTLEKTTAKIPSVHCIGWDMAYTNKSWVLVEANGRPQVVTIQVLTNKGFLDLFKKMVYLVEKDKNSDQESDY